MLNIVNYLLGFFDLKYEVDDAFLKGYNSTCGVLAVLYTFVGIPVIAYLMFKGTLR